MTTQEFVSYSQNGEDRKIIALFDQPGRFLDIGAWDPKQLSNTRALYEAGWSGVIIEPSPTPFLSQLREYGFDERITLVHAAVGSERGLARFFCTDDAVSTTEQGQYERWKPHAKFIGEFYVPVLTLNDIFNQFGGPFDFVNIDVEGCSVDLLHVLLKTPAFPACICVEHDGRVVEVQQAGERNGYRVLTCNGENVVLAR